MKPTIKADFKVKSATLSGSVVIPPSKSHTLRAILFGALGKGKSVIRHYLPSPDTEAMIEACRLFGARVDVTSDAIEIHGINGQIAHAKDVINAGNSGIVLRFCAALGALSKHPVVVTGDASARKRPMADLVDGLSQLGASAVSMRGDGYAPAIVRGPIQSGMAVINGEDSQPVSALLIMGAFTGHPVDIVVKNPGEKPWVAMTLHWFDRLGIRYENMDYRRYRLFGNSRYDGFEYTVPGDMSSAAFPLAAALITGSEIALGNIDMDDPQGDKELIEVFRKMGAQIDIDRSTKTLFVRKGQRLKGAHVDINNFVDAITILAVVACYAEGQTHIVNGAVARHKECDRIGCIVKELRKMGADIVETEDGLRIRKSTLRGATVQSHNDHRMAMSLAVAGLGAKGETCVNSVECVSKTYPTFRRDLNALGASL